MTTEPLRSSRRAGITLSRRRRNDAQALVLHRCVTRDQVLGLTAAPPESVKGERLGLPARWCLPPRATNDSLRPSTPLPHAVGQEQSQVRLGDSGAGMIQRHQRQEARIVGPPQDLSGSPDSRPSCRRKTVGPGEGSQVARLFVASAQSPKSHHRGQVKGQRGLLHVTIGSGPRTRFCPSTDQ